MYVQYTDNVVSQILWERHRERSTNPDPAFEQQLKGLYGICHLKDFLNSTG